MSVKCNPSRTQPWPRQEVGAGWGFFQSPFLSNPKYLEDPFCWGILAYPTLKKNKAHNGILKTALETLKGITSNDT